MRFMSNMIRVKVDFNFNYKYSLLDWFNGHHQGLARMQNAQTQNGQFVYSTVIQNVKDQREYDWMSDFFRMDLT